MSTFRVAIFSFLNVLIECRFNFLSGWCSLFHTNLHIDRFDLPGMNEAISIWVLASLYIFCSLVSFPSCQVSWVVHMVQFFSGSYAHSEQSYKLCSLRYFYTLLSTLIGRVVWWEHVIHNPQLWNWHFSWGYILVTFKSLVQSCIFFKHYHSQWLLYWKWGHQVNVFTTILNVLPNINMKTKLYSFLFYQC